MAVVERMKRYRERQREGSVIFRFEGNEVAVKALLEEARLLPIDDWEDDYKVEEALTKFMRTIVKQEREPE